MKEIVLLAGPNGAGKTTASRLLMPELFSDLELLNADEIAREISPAYPDMAAFTAGRELIARMRNLISAGRGFVLETTCAGKSYLRMLEQCRRDGWQIVMLYFWLSSPELSIQRVARRVVQGGHGIPSDVIFRRFYAGIWNMRPFSQLQRMTPIFPLLKFPRHTSNAEPCAIYFSARPK